MPGCGDISETEKRPGNPDLVIHRLVDAPAFVKASPGGAEMSTGKPEIRRCHGIEELEACVHLQKEVWNFSDLDLIPLRLFVVADKIGGQVLGAFEGKNLIGFTLSIPGARNNHPYLHSHMLAVREQYRNLGLGRKLKLAQREDALARRWQFEDDPVDHEIIGVTEVDEKRVAGEPRGGPFDADDLRCAVWVLVAQP